MSLEQIGAAYATREPKESAAELELLSGEGTTSDRIGVGPAADLHLKVGPKIGQVGIGPSMFVLAGPAWKHPVLAEPESCRSFGEPIPGCHPRPTQPDPTPPLGARLGPRVFFLSTAGIDLQLGDVRDRFTAGFGPRAQVGLLVRSQPDRFDPSVGFFEHFPESPVLSVTVAAEYDVRVTDGARNTGYLAILVGVGGAAYGGFWRTLRR